jgi:hypothetical protein
MYKTTQQHSIVLGTVQSFITKGKQRLKQFGFNSTYSSTSGTVYLKQGDSFEIELHNPKSTRVLARIKIDGKYLSGGGIILRPGERIFLERFLDTARKFLFDTYEVSNTQESKNAIADNGNVEIEYFDEVVPFYPQNYYGGITWSGGCSSGTWLGGCNTVTAGNTLRSFTSNNSGVNTFNVSNNAGRGDSVNFTSDINVGATTDSLNFMDQQLNRSAEPKASLSKPRSKKSIETGRVELGEVSNQKFVTVDAKFNLYTFKIDRWKILPESQKPYVSSDIKAYCGECGAKIKKSSFKFCPHCGSKID